MKAAVLYKPGDIRVIDMDTPYAWPWRSDDPHPCLRGMRH